MTVAQLLQLITPLLKLYTEYQALKNPTPSDTLHFGVKALSAIADTGVTLQELAALLQELGPVLPLLVKLAK